MQRLGNFFLESQYRVCMYISMYGYDTLNAYQMKVVILPAVCWLYVHVQYLSRCSLPLTLPNPHIQNYLNTYPLQHREQLPPLVVNYFDPELFVGLSPLPVTQSTNSLAKLLIWPQTMTVRGELVTVGFNTNPTDLI